MFPQPPGSHRPDTPCPSSTLVLSGGRGRWSPPPVLPCRRRGAGLQASTSALALLVSGVAGEGARRRELAQLMADHFLIDEDGDELAAVVDVERQPNELRQDRRPARPGLDRCAGTCVLFGLSLLPKADFDERKIGKASGREKGG